MVNPGSASPTSSFCRLQADTQVVPNRKVLEDLHCSTDPQIVVWGDPLQHQSATFHALPYFIEL